MKIVQESHIIAVQADETPEYGYLASTVSMDGGEAIVCQLVRVEIEPGKEQQSAKEIAVLCDKTREEEGVVGICLVRHIPLAVKVLCIPKGSSPGDGDQAAPYPPTHVSLHIEKDILHMLIRGLFTLAASKWGGRWSRGVSVVHQITDFFDRFYGFIPEERGDVLPVEVRATSFEDLGSVSSEGREHPLALYDAGEHQWMMCAVHAERGAPAGTVPGLLAQGDRLVFGIERSRERRVFLVVASRDGDTVKFSSDLSTQLSGLITNQMQIDIQRKLSDLAADYWADDHWVELKDYLDGSKVIIEQSDVPDGDGVVETVTVKRDEDIELAMPWFGEAAEA